MSAILSELAEMNLTSDSDTFDVHAVSAAIERLFKETGSEDIGEYVEDLVRSGRVSASEGSTLVNVAAWSGSENGASTQRTLDRWLEEATDPLRVRMALSQEVYPFRSGAKMREVLERAVARYPEFSERIAYLMATRPKSL